MKKQSNIIENNFESKYPDFAKYWHTTLNGDLLPSEISPNSNKNYWWTCEANHAYQRSADKQVRSTASCPVCNGRRLARGVNGIKTKYPLIADEWDYDYNAPDKPEDFTFASSQRKGWKCNICGHKWIATIKSRCKDGHGCPVCARKKVWEKRFENIELGITDKKLLDEWDYELNEKGPECYTPQSSAIVNWHCKKCGYRYKAKISNKANGRKCACCQRKTVVSGVNDLATTHPKIAAEWDYERNGDLKPEDFLAGTRSKVYWRCPKGHSYEASINHRTTPGRETNCPKCVEGRQTSFAEQAVFYYVKKIFPDAINRYCDIFKKGMELDIFIPSIKVAIEYDGEAWHKSDKREREKRKYQICKEHGIKLIRLIEKMPSNEVVYADEGISILDGPMYQLEQLQKVIISLIDELDPESNFLTRKNYFHVHSDLDINVWRDEAEIRKYMTTIKGSLVEKYPELMREWNYELNGELTPDKIKPGSGIKVWWKCPQCGRIYQASVYTRTGKKPTGCPDCGIKKNAMMRYHAVAMINLETGAVIREFPSVTAASKEMSISSGNISAVCKQNTCRTQAGGFGWKYI